MLKIIFYCYSRGIIISRPIEYACKTNIIIKALARDAELDHDTIAHFISSQAEAYGSGSGYFPEMLDNLNETVKGMSGEEEPLEDVIMEGDTGYFTEKNLKAAEERKIEVIIPDQQFRKRDGHFDGPPGHGGRDSLR
jgi:hypothetical protein